MHTRLIPFGCSLLALLLAAGCQTTATPGAAPEKLAHVESTSVEVLAGVLAQAGLSDSNLVLEATITLPPPAGGDAHPKPAWTGAWAGQPAATLQAGDRVLVIAKSIQCGAIETKYTFNPFTRTWTLQAGDTGPEGNWLRVLFDGSARDFAAAAAAAREEQAPLAALAAGDKAAAAASFPAAVTVDGMLGNLTELGLSRLSVHLKAEHADHPCNPDIHVYVKPAAGR